MLIKLKKMRIKAKNELAEAQNQLLLSQKEHDIRYKKMMKALSSSEDQELARRASKVPKGFNKFLDSVSAVL